jgi:hypothetical protein
MGFTNPFRMHNYLGERASDSATLTFVRDNKWDTTQDGSGVVPDGTWYYNNVDHKFRARVNSAWVDFGNQSGPDWQDSVIDRISTPPSSGISDGDRYLVKPTGAGGWSGKDNDIAQYNGGISGWVYTAPSEGMAVWVESEDYLYIYNGLSWVKFGSTLDLVTHAELASVTPGSEGATLVGTSTKTHLGNAVTVEAALAFIDAQAPKKWFTGAGNPNGVVTASGAGDRYLDSTNTIFYEAVTNNNSSWKVVG